MSTITTITDFGAHEFDIYARFTEAQLANSEGLFIAESETVISLALDAGYKPVSALIEDTYLSHDIISRLQDIPIYTASHDMLINLTGYNLTQGMLCAMKRPTPKSISEICKGATRIAVLEHIMNPTNIGAIIRSAAALGIDAMLLTPDCSDPLYRRAARVSMGTVFKIPWGYFEKSDTEHHIDTVKGLGFKTVAMALCDNSIDIDDKRLANEPKLAIVMGSEGEGLSAKTIKSCDYTVRIPMHHGVDSLNVAAASAVAFWQLGTK